MDTDITDFHKADAAERKKISDGKRSTSVAMRWQGSRDKAVAELVLVQARAREPEICGNERNMLDPTKNRSHAVFKSPGGNAPFYINNI